MAVVCSPECINCPILCQLLLIFGMHLFIYMLPCISDKFKTKYATCSSFSSITVHFKSLHCLLKICVIVFSEVLSSLHRSRVSIILRVLQIIVLLSIECSTVSFSVSKELRN